MEKMEKLKADVSLIHSCSWIYLWKAAWEFSSGISGEQLIQGLIAFCLKEVRGTGWKSVKISDGLSQDSPWGMQTPMGALREGDPWDGDPREGRSMGLELWGKRIHGMELPGKWIHGIGDGRTTEIPDGIHPKSQFSLSRHLWPLKDLTLTSNQVRKTLGASWEWGWDMELGEDGASPNQSQESTLHDQFRSTVTACGFPWISLDFPPSCCGMALEFLPLVFQRHPCLFSRGAPWSRINVSCLPPSVCRSSCESLWNPGSFLGNARNLYLFQKHSRAIPFIS